MEDEKKDIEVTVQTILTAILCVAICIGILALIWASWKTLQVCATFAFLTIVGKMVLPEDL